METNDFSGRGRHEDTEDNEEAQGNHREDQSELIPGGSTSDRKRYLESVIKKSKI